MNSIIVIGVNPPCPRCKLLGKVIDEKVKELHISADVRHIAYTDPEAKRFAQSIGLETGTAKIVSQKIQLEIDSQKIHAALNNRIEKPDCEFRDYNDCNWSFELDELLRPFEKKAKEVEILMTPALIINEELKHQGSVPPLSKINEWLMELL